MKKIATVPVLIGAALLFVSFSTNPPDGMTGAPGDSFCTECHSLQSSTLQGTIDVEGFPLSITPGETYDLTVVNRNTAGNAVRAGFQMTILGPVNTRAGDMTNPSAGSVVSNFAGRQYFEHNPAQEYPDSSVVRWHVQWTAPELPSGSQITWYAAGNIANGNFQNTGDRIVGANGSGSVVIASSQEPIKEAVAFYPNPGQDVLHISLPASSLATGSVIFYNFIGYIITELPLHQGAVNTSCLAPGSYIVELRSGEFRQVQRWIKL